MSLLERFQEGSELDSHGQFTLDESKAREKMARFQLVSTEEFLMLAIQAAVAAGCSALEVSLDGTEIRLVAREALLDAESVRQLRLFLFDSQPENVAYNLLAVAANAVEPSCLTPPLVAMVDEDLHFEANLKESLGDLSSLISSRLRYFPHPLSLSGIPLQTEPLQEQPQVELLAAGPSSVVLVRYGVVVAQRARSLPIEFRAVARADHLSLDASFSQVVEDSHYEGLMKRLETTANQLLAEKASRYQPEGPEGPSLLAHLDANHPDPAGSALSRCPFFPYADRPGYASLEDALKLVAREGKLLVAQRNYNLQLDTPVLRVDDPALSRVLRSKLPANCAQDAGPAFIAKAAAERNKAAWEASPRPTELPPGRYLAQTQISGLTWEAAIGFLAAPGGPSRADILYQGKLLTNETLTNVPPDSAVVLNVRQAEVHPSWTRLDGRQYRGVLKELQERINSFFHTLNLPNPEDLSPQLTQYLLGLLRGKEPPAVARNTPLFSTVNGARLLSVSDVKRLPEVACGDAVTFSEKIPVKDLFPSPLLAYSPAHFQALVACLGANRVKDVRERQARLRDLDIQMKSPRQPLLPVRTDLLCKTALEIGSARGEIGLIRQSGGKLDAALLQNGVFFEELKAFGGRAFSAVAVLECPDLTLKPHWDGFVCNDLYSKLQTGLRNEAVRLELELLERPLPRELIWKLASAYPQEKAKFLHQELFETSTSGNYASLSQLQDEIARHGHLLRGEPGVVLPGRLVMRTPDKETQALLQDTLGNFRWEDAGTLLRQYQQAAEFESRPVYEEIALSGDHPVVLPVPAGRGQLGLHPRRTTGEVHCFVRGRFVCTKCGVIPPPFVAAVESESFQLRDDFKDVTIPAAYREMLADLCGQAMLEAAVRPQPELRELAWAYFSKGNSSRVDDFRQLVTLSRLGGETLTLATVAASKVRGYVSERFTFTLPPKGLILRLSADEARRVSTFLGRQLMDLEKELKAEQTLHNRLAALPTSLAAELYQKRFEADGISATIGLSLNRKTVGTDDAGRPVGLLRDLPMPVQAIVSGAEADPKKTQEIKASLPAKGWKLLGQWSEELCLQWVKERADDGQLLRQLLLLSMREVGSRDTNRPLSEMATLLWDMPLFSRVDGTRVSGAALAATLSETEQPILVADSTFRVPGSAIYLPEASDERAILVGILGKSQLLWYEVPPLFDAAEMKASVQRLVSWGFSPVTRSIAAVGKLLEKSAAKPDTPKEGKRGPRETLVVALKEDVANLLGREHYRKSNDLFRALDYGHWPLGPPIYKRSNGAFRLNALHSGVRWLLSDEGDERLRRAARILLVVHWVGLVNEASEELRDSHEDAFLSRLAERMTQTFRASAQPESRAKTAVDKASPAED